MSFSSFVQDLQSQGHDVHAVKAVQRGQVLGQQWWPPYRPEARHVLYSLTKTFTALGALFAVQEGRLGLDDAVLDHLSRPRTAPPSARWERVTVRHLLTMTLGFDQDPMDRVVPTRDWVATLLALELDHEPGTRFVYNNMASYLVSAVVQAATGQPLRDWLVPRLFDPLGIVDPRWDQCPRRRTIGGWGLYLTLDEVTRLGEFLLAGGEWGGTRHLARDLLEQAVGLQTVTGTNPLHDSQQGYGFQVWRCRHGAYRADGAFGQLCVVWPARELVVAVQAGVPDAQPLLDALWRHFGADETESPADPGVQEYRPPEAASDASARVAPWLGRPWELAGHPAGWSRVGLGGTPAAPEFWYQDDRGIHRAPFGWGQWVESLSGLWRHDSQRRRRFITVASGHWSDEGALVLTLRFPEQAPVVTLSLHLSSEGLRLDQHLSVTLQPSNFSGIRGTPCTP